MPRSYLCASHRRQLLNDPVAADETWRHAFSCCLTLPEASRYQERVNLAGCAYEAAHILITAHKDESRRSILRLTSSARQLVHWLREAGERRAVAATIGQTVTILQQLLRKGVARDLILAACQTLMHLDETGRKDAVSSPAPWPAMNGHGMHRTVH